ncbi:MAG: 3-phosphoshikimate 1-carboxyvinyltransferase [Chloroflexi bacterium]|nr:3-phosphoshikimate 1-carboxyvinyltransferase [Chloroflexota bacterium]
MTVSRPPRLRGAVQVPGDKSITHRALLFNAIAAGDATVTGFLDAADTRDTLEAVRALGVKVDEVGDGRLVVHGRGRAGVTEAADVLDCGNSGTTMRLLSGLLAGFPFMSVLSGDASLRRRPMGRIVQPLRTLGARVTARAEGTLPPIVVEGGPLAGGQHIETPVASAQVKSAILLAGLAADGSTQVTEPAHSRDHTERMLGAMGADVVIEGTSVTLTPPEGDLHAIDVHVPGDISTAAAWIVAATLHPDADLVLARVGVSRSRAGIIDVLSAMGADIEMENPAVVGGEPVADLHVRSAGLRGVRIDGVVVPRAIDELPLLALAGALAEGDTVIADAAELRVKESDRVATTAATLRALGAEVEEHDDGLAVAGGAQLRGAPVEAAGDHRLAMLGAVAGLLAEGETTVSGAGAVAVSYPDFWADLARVGASPAAARA